MNWQASFSVVLSSAISLTASVLSHSQNPQSPQLPETTAQAATVASAEPGLMLVSAERVYLGAELGTVVQTGSGRGSPSIERARGALETAIARWDRFTIVDDPRKADLALVIVEGNRNSGIRVGVLRERLLVSRGGSSRGDQSVMWKSQDYDGGVRDYRPVGKTVDELRAAIDQYEKKIPRETLQQARVARKPSASSGGCAGAESDFGDCLSHGGSRLYLPEDREENGGVAKLSEVAISASLLDVAKRVSVEQLSDYVAAIQKLLKQQYSTAEQQPGKDLAVEGELRPDGKAEFRLASRPQIDQEQMQRFYDVLLGLPRPAVKDGPIEFRMVFLLWGGSGESHTER